MKQQSILPRRQSFILALLLLFLFSTTGRAEKIEQAGSTVTSLYQDGRYEEVITLLKEKGPQDSQQALYLGLSALRLGKKAEAIEAWKGYVRMEPGSEGTREISRHLTLLIQEEAKRSAREMLQQEKTLSKNVDAKAIAVSPFQNLGKQNLAPLSKGLAEMVITDLSKVKTLKVVERIQIQAILNELKLSQSLLVDKKSAPRVGKLLGAGKITTGSFLDVDAERLRLDAAVTETEKGKLLTSPEVTGGLSNFFQLEKALVFKILCGIGHCPESLDSETKASVEKIHTRNLKAFTLYSQGLDLSDQGQYREASRFFFMAVEEDPEFDLARKALLETPLFPLDLSAMIASAESLGHVEKGNFNASIVLAPPVLPEKGSGMHAMAPSINMVPIAPPAAGAGAATTVPVTIGVQFK
jgi:TolB-like protein